MNRATAATTLRHRRLHPFLEPSVRGNVAFPSRASLTPPEDGRVPGLSPGHVRSLVRIAGVGYTVFHAADLDWQPRREGDPRLAAGLSEAMTQSRANLFRYPPGAVGRRHIDPIQEEVFVVLDGTLTIHMGEGDEPERHELAKGSVLSSSRARRCSSRTATTTSCACFIVGAPPERGETTFLEQVE